MKAITIPQIFKLKSSLVQRYANMHRQHREVKDLYFGDYHVLSEHTRKSGKVHEVIPASARILVDGITAHVKPQDLEVKFEPVKNNEKAREIADQSEEAAKVFIKRHASVKANSAISELSKNVAIYGLSGARSMFNALAWGERPKRKNGESKEDFEWREGIWESKRNMNLPFTLDAIDPLNMLPGSFDMTPPFMIETYKVQPFFLQEQFPHYQDPNPFAEKQFTSFWSSDQWLYILGSQEIEDRIRSSGNSMQQFESFLSGQSGAMQAALLRVQADGTPTDYNPYGICPYTVVLSGLGKRSPEGKPEEQAVGLLYPLKSIIKEGARSLTAISIILQVTAMPRFLTRYAPKGGINIGMAPGDTTEIGGAVIEPFPDLRVPPDMYNIIQILDQQMEMLLGAKLMTGMRPAGVTSALFEEILLEQAERRYLTLIESIEAAVARIIAQQFYLWEHLVKEKIPGIKLDPAKLRGAYNCMVDFKYEDIAKQRIKTMIAKMMFQAGLYDFETAHNFIGTENISDVRKGLVKDMVYRDPRVISALGLKAMREMGLDAGQLYDRAAQRGNERRRIELPSQQEEGVLQQLLGKGVEQSPSLPGFSGGGFGANLEGGGEPNLESLGV